MSGTTVNQRLCSVEGCDRTHYGRGLCNMHYLRWQRRGRTYRVLRRSIPIHDREGIKAILLERRTVKLATGCWEWTGGRMHGYGSLSIGNREYRVSRLSAYVWLGFDIDNDLLICHTCDNPPCFNPEHLFPGTKKANAEDMVAKGRRRGPVGSESPNAVLNEFKVQRMRLLRAVSDLTLRELGLLYGVSEATVKKVVYRWYWRHI